MKHSHTTYNPHKWGGLDTQLHLYSWRYLFRSVFGSCIFNPLQAPTKLESLSVLMCFGAPQREKNLTSVLMKLNLHCTYTQTAQLTFFAWPPQVRSAETSQGPNMPSKWKGVCSLSAGRSDICYCLILSQSFLVATHLKIVLWRYLFPSTSDNLWARMEEYKLD